MTALRLMRKGALLFLLMGSVFPQVVRGEDILEQALARFKNEEFQGREEAQAELVTWAVTGGEKELKVSKLLKSYVECKDPEARWRFRKVLKSLRLSDQAADDSPGFLGIGMRSIHNVSPEIRSAVRVNSVHQGSPADIYGLKVGDIIIGTGLLAVNNNNDLAYQIGSKPPGAQIVIKLLRGKNKEEHTLKVILARRPDPGEVKSRFTQLTDHGKNKHRELDFQAWLQEEAEKILSEQKK